MPAIGNVAKDETGTSTGQLKTLSICAEIAIVANASKRNDAEPDYRVLSGDVESALARWVAPKQAVATMCR